MATVVSSKEKNISFLEHSEYHASLSETELNAAQSYLEKVNVDGDDLIKIRIERVYKLIEMLREQSIRVMLEVNGIKKDIES